MKTPLLNEPVYVDVNAHNTTHISEDHAHTTINTNGCAFHTEQGISSTVQLARTIRKTQSNAEERLRN